MSHRWGWVGSAVLSAAIASAALSPARASIVYSDDFNSDTPGLNNTPTGWIATPGAVDIIGTGSNGTLDDFYGGNGLGYYIDLNGTPGYGGLESTAVFSPGTYTVDFILGSSQGGVGHVDDADTPKTTDISFTGTAVQPISLPSEPPTLNSESLTFTLTSTGHLLFTSLPDSPEETSYAPYVGNILDNVVVSTNDGSLTTTPLPGTWSMLLAGFIGLGYLSYRGGRKSFGAMTAA